MRGKERLRKVSELNEILPQVRITIEKEKRIKKLKKELSKKSLSFDLIGSHKKEIEQLETQCDSENKYYKNVVEKIATSGGFLQRNDIQEEYLEEYIYLLVFDKSFNKRFSIETLFCNSEIFNVFSDMVVNKFSIFKAEILEELYYERADKEMFLKLFK